MNGGRVIRVVVMGNSVGMFVRPPGVTAHDTNYAARLPGLLRARGCTALVYNLCRHSEVIDHTLADWHSRMFVFSPDVVVVQLGINECVPRLLPGPFFRALSGVRLNENPLSRVIRARLSSLINRVAAPPLIRTLRLRPWYTLRRFRAKYSILLGAVSKEWHGQLICMAICQTNSRVEALLPGSMRRIAEYNEVILEQAVARGGLFLDPMALWDAERAESMMPDGIHFSAVGHWHVANAVADAVARFARELGPDQA